MSAESGSEQLRFDADDATPAVARGVDTVLIYSDGGARGNPGPAAIGAVVFDGSSQPARPLASVSEYIGETTNNVAEYKAMIAGLEAARQFGARRVVLRADSMLVIRQVEGVWKVKQPHLRPFVVAIQRLLDDYDDVVLEHVPRELNTDADMLVNAALDAR